MAKPLYCSLGHEMETKEDFSGRFAKCPCMEHFARIGDLLSNKTAFWDKPKQIQDPGVEEKVSTAQ